MAFALESDPWIQFSPSFQDLWASIYWIRKKSFSPLGKNRQKLIISKTSASRQSLSVFKTTTHWASFVPLAPCLIVLSEQDLRLVKKKRIKQIGINFMISNGFLKTLYFGSRKSSIDANGRKCWSHRLLMNVIFVTSLVTLQMDSTSLNSWIIHEKWR